MINCETLTQVSVMNKPATMDEIMQAQYECGVLFSKDFVDLLRCSNGLQVEDLLSLTLYATNEIEERNTTYEVAIYASTMLCIGDDGGGRCVLLEKEKGAVYLVDMGSMMKKDATFLASSLAEWIESGFSLKDPQEEKTKYVDIYLMRPPTGGSKGLLRLKKALNLRLSPLKLRQALQKTPSRLLRSVNFQKNARLCQKYNKSDPCLGLFEVDQPNCPL